MIVLIPSYEPTEKLIQVISELKKHSFIKIVIVDDGNKDKYEDIFATAWNLECIVLKHNANEGKGAALKTGFKYILSNFPKENVVCADSDGQHTTIDILKIAQEIDEASSEMVLGVRKFEGSVPLKSRIGNSITAFLFNVATKIRISDTQTGLRGYPYTMLPWLLSIEGTRFEYEFNLLLKAKLVDISIKQVPFKTVYENNNKGTHFNPIKDSIKIYLPLFKFTLSSFSSAIIDFSLLFLFQAIIKNLFFSVVFARLISSIYNYSINKYLVFKAKSIKSLQSAPKYFGLVLIIMLLNYSLLLFMTAVLYIPSVIAKIATELILFLISYTVQRKIIFKEKSKKLSKTIQSTHILI